MAGLAFRVWALAGPPAPGLVPGLSGYVTLRHAVPLANVDANEFEVPMKLVLHSADVLERKLTGADNL